MTRSAATWTTLRCEDGTDVVFRHHWAGLVEVACDECRVMLSYGGRERLGDLPPESLVALLRQLLELARTEQRNRPGAEVLCAHLERGLHVDDVQADEPQTTGSPVPS
jgi:hypothetical protein